MSFKDIFIKPKVTEKRSDSQSVPRDDSEYSYYSNGISLFNAFGLSKSNRSLSAVYACVELISNALSSILLRVMCIDKNGHKEIIKHHPVQKIFANKTISTMSMLQIIKSAISDVLLKGNGFIYIKRGQSGVVTGFRYLSASDVSVIYNDRTDTVHYLCPKITTKKIKPEQMIHLTKNTRDGVNGVSVAAYAQDTIKLSQSAEKSAKNYFDSGCLISGILSPQNMLQDKQRNQIINSWKKDAEGNSIQVLPYGLTYQSIGTNSKDAQLLETRQYNLQEVCRYFGVNPVLLQDMSQSLSSLEQVNIQFLQYTLMPYIRCIETEFTRKLFLDEDMIVDMDEDAYLLRTDKKSTADYYSAFVTNGVMSINEVRKQLGLAEVEDGDHHMVLYSDASKATIDNKAEDK